MASPFPGMDPFLEGSLWPDVHHELASKIRRQLIPLISPKYVARINRYVVDDDEPENEFGIMYPDVEVLLNKSVQKVEEPAVAYGGGKTPMPVSLTIPMIAPIEVRIPVVEVRDRDGNRLITAIEILSPVNKRKPGLEPYLQKRIKLHSAKIHLLEIDLLRRGTRSVQHSKLKKTDYLIALTRGDRSRTDIWTIDLRSPLPVVPVPLAKPDEDVLLDLQQALYEVYDEAAYYLSIDYASDPPPPELTPGNRNWMKSLVSK